MVPESRLSLACCCASLVALALLVGGCGSGPQGVPDASPAAPASATADENGLLEVPYPDLASFERSVEEQLTLARDAVESVQERADVAEAERAATFGEAGMVYHAYALWSAAEACYRNAARLDPTDDRWLYYLALVQSARARVGEAVEYLERFLDGRPSYLPAVLGLARTEFQRNQHDRSESFYRRALDVDPRSAEALAGLARIAWARGDTDEAILHWERARQIVPEASEINHPLGLAYRARGEREKALALLELRGPMPAVDDPLLRAVHERSRGMRIHQFRATALMKMGLFDAARAEFEMAVEASPADPLPRTNLGNALIRLGEFDAARQALDEALRLDPTLVVAYLNLGDLESRLGKDDRAVQHFRRVIELDPREHRAHYELAGALRRLGRYEEALVHYRETVRQDPGNGRARLDEALTLVRLHRYTEAREGLETAMAAFPEQMELRHILVRLLAAAPDDEVRDVRRALQLARPMVNRDALFEHAETFAMVAAGNGQYRQAQALQQRLIEQARQSGRSDLLPKLEENLRRYGRGEPCRTPWPDDHPLLSPGPRQPVLPDD